MLSSHAGSVDFHHTALREGFQRPYCQKKVLDCPAHLGELSPPGLPCMTRGPIQVPHGEGSPRPGQFAGQPSAGLALPVLQCSPPLHSPPLPRVPQLHGVSREPPTPRGGRAGRAPGVPCGSSVVCDERGESGAVRRSLQSQSCPQRKENRLDAVILAPRADHFRNMCLK